MTKLTSWLILMMVLVEIALPGKIHAASLRLSWTDGSDNETGFKIERLVGQTYAEIATVGAGVTSYTDSGLTNGAIYCYQVRAFNSAGSSAPSNQACASFSDLTVSSLGNTAVLTQSQTNTGSTSTSVSSSASSNNLLSPLGGPWADYRVTLKIKSTDNDSIGVMFRYVDNRNYYRFSWDKQRSSRRLEKLEKDVRTVLIEDAVPYVIGQIYQLQIVARGTTLEVWIDGSLIFLIIDESFDAGTIALYSWYNQGNVFDDVLVEDLSTGTDLLWKEFNDGDVTGWTIVDEGTVGGSSAWSVIDGAFVQRSNIGSNTHNKLGTFAVYTKRD